MCDPMISFLHADPQHPICHVFYFHDSWAHYDVAGSSTQRQQVPDAQPFCHKTKFDCFGFRSWLWFYHHVPTFWRGAHNTNAFPPPCVVVNTYSSRLDTSISRMQRSRTIFATKIWEMSMASLSTLKQSTRGQEKEAQR